MKIDPAQYQHAKQLVDALAKAGIKPENMDTPETPMDYFEQTWYILEKQIEFLRKENQRLEDEIKAEKEAEEEKIIKPITLNLENE
jgi:hypothetical protein